MIGEAVQRLQARPQGFFAIQGSESTYSAIKGLFESMGKGIVDQKPAALKAYLSHLISDQLSAGLSFQDLRLMCVVIRQILLDSLERINLDSSVEAIRCIEEQCHDLVLLSALYYTAKRDETIAEQRVLLEVRLGELQAAHEEQIRVTQLLQEVWTPIAPIYEGILVVPLVGSLDSQRAQELAERLLNEVTRSQARFVLLDISGVPFVDTAIATYIVNMARAIRLLGGEVVLVGILPEVAQAIVQLGLDLSGLSTQGTLREGLRIALTRMGYAIVPRR